MHSGRWSLALSGGLAEPGAGLRRRSSHGDSGAAVVTAGEPGLEVSNEISAGTFTAPVFLGRDFRVTMQAAPWPVPVAMEAPPPVVAGVHGPGR